MKSAHQNEKPLLRYLEWLLALGATFLLTITEVYSTSVIAGMVLLALFFALRMINGRLWSERTGLEIPAILFISSAIVAAFISHNQGSALLQFARILAGLALFTLVVQSNLAEQRWLGVGFVIAAVVLAVYWPLQNDFATQPIKVKVVHTAGLWIENNLPDFKIEALTGLSIHPAVASGVLLIALPAAVVLAIDAWQSRRRLLSALAGLSIFLILATLFLASIRGAWMALAAMVGLAILILVQRRWFSTHRRKHIFWGSFIIIGILAVVYLSDSNRLTEILGAIPDPTGTVMARLDLWKDGLGLIRSYPFTGSGLASFYMVHSTYSLLTHSPLIQHAHNTFLQVWIEQGILGVLGILWGSGILFTKSWHALDIPDKLFEKPTIWWGWAGLIMLAGNAVQGLVDVTMYIERTLPLYGLVFGYAWLTFRRIDERPDPPNKLKMYKRLAAGVGLLIFCLVGMINRPELLGAWYANQGALSQARLELNQYDPNHFAALTLDKVRQSIDLSQAEASFQEALIWQPSQVTALQRLSIIALSRGEYQEALDLSQTAWNAFYRDDVTRLLYGDALVANGQIKEASRVVQGLPRAEGRLMFQAYYRYWVNQDYLRCLDAWRAVKLINPYNREADRWITELEQKLNQKP